MNENQTPARRFEVMHDGQILLVYDGAGEQILRFGRIVDE